MMGRTTAHQRAAAFGIPCWRNCVLDARLVFFVRLLLFFVFCSSVNPDDCYGDVKENIFFMT